LFDAYVGSILGYASEIWSFTKSKDWFKTNSFEVFQTNITC
jgi:hypothetical protein